MEARMPNPALIVPNAMPALYALSGTAKQADLPPTLLGLVHLRASQINGCSFCLDMHARDLRKLGESDERLFGVAAFRESPYFTDAERAALALTEAATRLCDRADPVPDAIWEEARRHFNQASLAALIVQIGLINFWNRMNVVTRQIAGSHQPEATRPGTRTAKD